MSEDVKIQAEPVSLSSEQVEAIRAARLVYRQLTEARAKASEHQAALNQWVARREALNTEWSNLRGKLSDTIVGAA